MPATKPSHRIEVKPKPDQIKALYAAKRKHLLKIDPAMRKVAIYLDQWVQRNFKTEGGNVGGWKPLTQREGRILQDTGRLRASFVPFTAKNNAGIGSDLDYSKTHDKGIGHVPKRRILPQKKDVMKQVRRILKRHIEVVRSVRT